MQQEEQELRRTEQPEQMAGWFVALCSRQAPTRMITKELCFTLQASCSAMLVGNFTIRGSLLRRRPPRAACAMCRDLQNRLLGTPLAP